jgi:pimeloyl-ACP methyl ester carboxylesterase
MNQSSTSLHPAAGQLPDSFQHQAALVNDVRLHYVTGGRPLGTAPLMLLIHGFPQNWWSWHRVMPALGEHYTLVVPDLRGIGLSDRPPTGYDKTQLSADLYGIVQSLNAGPAHVVGHDIGGMVAYAYARQFPLRTLTVLDMSLPGVGDWDQILADPIIWHFPFHQKRDLPEALICGGREHAYISQFIYSQSHIRGAISADDMDEYVRAYTHPGAFRAAMEMYRQFPKDTQDNRAAGRLPPDLKVMALGAETRWGTRVAGRLSAVSDRVEGGAIANSGHFISEEQPALLIEALLKFCK